MRRRHRRILPWTLLLCSVLALATSEAQARRRYARPPLHETVNATLPVVVEHIEILGLTRTDPEVVFRELPFDVGQRVEQEAWDFAITRLWNLDIFTKVGADIVRRDGKVIAIFTLEERWTLNPLFAFGAGSGVAWIRGGATDTNLLGRFVEVGAQYQRFTHFNGFQAWVRDPRFLGKHIDWLLLADQLVRPRGDFADRRLRFTTDLSWLGWRDALRLGGRVDVMRTTFIPADGSEPPANAPQDWAVAYSLAGTLGRVDTVRIRQEGLSVEVRASLIATAPPSLALSSDFGRLWLQSVAFLSAGERWNFAARVQAGIQGAAPRQLRFYLGGLDEVRGYRDNFAATSRYAFANLETRFIALDSTWIALQPALFVDGGVAASETGSARPMLSGGGGVRILFPWMVDSGLRIDVAVPLANGCAGTKSFCPDVSLGVYQYFDGKWQPASR